MHTSGHGYWMGDLIRTWHFVRREGRSINMRGKDIRPSSLFKWLLKLLCFVIFRIKYFLSDIFHILKPWFQMSTSVKLCFSHIYHNVPMQYIYIEPNLLDRPHMLQEYFRFPGMHFSLLYTPMLWDHLPCERSLLRQVWLYIHVYIRATVTWVSVYMRRLLNLKVHCILWHSQFWLLGREAMWD